MEIIYDPKADSLNITFRDGRVKKTVEIAPEVLLDIDEKGKPLYLEIVGLRDKVGRRKATEIVMRNLLPVPGS